jgi:hypothetical protein
MSDNVVTVRLSRSQAAFLQANLSKLAALTRQAMARPGLDTERHMALGSRAIVLEYTEDAVRSALLEVPNDNRNSTRDEEVASNPYADQQVPGFDGSSIGRPDSASCGFPQVT